MKTCLICRKKIIDKKHPNKIYCSIMCRTESRKNRVKRKCLNCKKEFFIKKSQIKRGRGKYCSYHCRSWKGGFVKRQDGYILIRKTNHPFNKNGYVPYHRFLMEKHIGRYLKKGEIIHHLDGNPSNNHISNLKLCKNLAEHRWIHEKLLK